MSMFAAAMRMCDDCDRTDQPLSWSRDGNTKICPACKTARGAREVGPPSERAMESARMEAALIPSGNGTGKETS